MDKLFRPEDSPKHGQSLSSALSTAEESHHAKEGRMNEIDKKGLNKSEAAESKVRTSTVEGSGEFDHYAHAGFGSFH